ncbi:nitroreductase/quinone reductase family protein [Streptomyces sp. NBC_00370]|uniref:nitroreductase/quinone reductase family protein n=1 Tax=Streptomyces sp. NBC_00370 TaxID=2975728 RepID=UPI002E2698AA
MPTSFNQSVIAEFRANVGKVGGPFAGGDLLLLTTTGARSGRPHTTPLGFARDGELLLVVGSNLGGPHHPGWYHNLLAHPVVQVEIGTATYDALAVPAEGTHRDQLFDVCVRAAPGYADYAARTERQLPVVILQRPEPDGWQPPTEVMSLADKLMEVHTWLRAQLLHVGAEVDAHFAARGAHNGLAEPPPALGLQIRQRCLAFCQGLEFHHTSEDAHLFPGIAAHHPDLTDVFAQLAAEHATVARIQDELAALLADITLSDPHRFRAEVARMSAELNAHLDHEEDHLLPLLTHIPWPPGHDRASGA